MIRHLAKGIIWTVALFYAYGALVHVMNILSLTGFEWSKAPVKWQALDIVYLFLDLVVAIGFFVKLRVSYIAFYIASISQIVLYTLLRSWVINVPKEFAISPEQESYLTVLVVFHIVTIILVTAALRIMHNMRLQEGPRGPRGL